MTLTQIQTDAIARARRGDYSLLDAMELHHRITEGRAAYGHLVGGRLRLVAYGDPEENPCGECGADGTVECNAVGCDDGDIDCKACAGTVDHTIAHEACGGEGCDDPACIGGQVECDICDGTGLRECTECHGDGFVDCPHCDGEAELPPERFENLRVENLDGRVLWSEHDDPDKPDDPWGWKGRRDRAWAESILAAYHKERSEGTGAPAAPSAPQPDILETAQCA